MSSLTAPSRNPFISNQLTPNPTGSSQSEPSISSNPPSFTETAETPTNSIANRSTANAGTSDPTHANTNEDTSNTTSSRRDFQQPALDEEPPAYTPAPDTVTGETTVEYGPRRPFQSVNPQPVRAPQPQPQLQQSYLRPQHTGISRPQSQSLWQQLTGQLANQLNTVMTELTTGGMQPQSSSPYPVQTPQSTGATGRWSAYPGQQQGQPPRPPHQPQSTPPSISRNSGLPPPPPRHPSILSASASATSNSALSAAPSVSRTRSLESRRPTSSDFARDFYAAGTPTEVLGTVGATQGENGNYAPPSGPPPPSDDGNTAQRSASYAPPPGPPPSSPTNTSVNARESRLPAQSHGRPGVADDGKPTSVPVPGHPLLKDGKLLVYPKGHECRKCKNTGYKNFDSSKPCKKCWPKYARPYTGALVYAFGDTNASTSNAALNTNPHPDSTTLQRPLPQRSARQPPPPRPSSIPSYPSSHHFAPPPHNQPRWVPPGSPNHQNGPYPRQFTPTYGLAPPGSVIYPAGDPRLGGSLCWRCTGTGSVSMFFLDATCPQCNGLGRVFA